VIVAGLPRQNQRFVVQYTTLDPNHKTLQDKHLDN